MFWVSQHQPLLFFPFLTFCLSCQPSFYSLFSPYLIVVMADFSTRISPKHPNPEITIFRKFWRKLHKFDQATHQFWCVLILWDWLHESSESKYKSIILENYEILFPIFCRFLYFILDLTWQYFIASNRTGLLPIVILLLSKWINSLFLFCLRKNNILPPALKLE